MTSLRTRGLLFVLALGSAAGAVVSCSDDAATGGTGGTGGKPSVGTGGASQATGGKANMASGGAASASGGAASASGGAASASGGAVSASGGAATTGGATSTGGATNAGGTGGGAAANPVAVATIAAVDDSQIAGTATFTQVGNMVTLVLALTGCPPGPHASHLHQNKACGGEAAELAGVHWSPKGEDLGNYICADGVGMLEVSKPTTTWTVGGGDTATDVTQFSFMVHAAGDPQAGARIACGLINLQ